MPNREYLVCNRTPDQDLAYLSNLLGEGGFVFLYEGADVTLIVFDWEQLPWGMQSLLNIKYSNGKQLP